MIQAPDERLGKQSRRRAGHERECIPPVTGLGHHADRSANTPSSLLPGEQHGQTASAAARGREIARRGDPSLAHGNEPGRTSIFGVVTGQCPAVGCSASLDAAVEQAHALVRTTPLLCAESTPVSLIVSATESARCWTRGRPTRERPGHPGLRDRRCPFRLGAVRGAPELDLVLQA